MARSGDRFKMPDGSVYVLRQPAAESGGEVVEMEFVLPSGCVPPPPHVHRSQVESYEVVEGSFEVVVEGRWQTLEVGDTVAVPVGALHTFRNRSGDVVRVRNWHRPALRFEEFIAHMSEALRDANVRRKRDPRVFMVLSTVMLEYEETLAVPRRRDRVPMQALALTGRRLSSL